MEPAKTEQNETFRPDNGADDQLGPGSGRHAAGEDPAKRQQILEGARRVFMSQGFDAASMNDITREAGVSKGTLYVYFENKEDLFKALIIQGKTLVIQTAKHALNDHEDVEEALYDFGVTLTSSITSEATIRSMRMVIGVIDRMPHLAERFFSEAPENGYTVLKTYLDRQVPTGTLDIDNTEVAARQFIEMAQAGLFKHRLFGGMCSAPPREQIEGTVAAAVRVFMAAYGPKKKTD
ncbi:MULTISPECIES: TetR/AcrR family transcriptional regulator [Ensifer]|uniref:TetR family transcriptional regulator n=1 Tax=Ensifer canadensis TaxID=555315 RepID=A0AAW4FU24_9HYPH|nr:MULTISPECIES: TetR/AcrR family transcriptional regulator [Ensifer]MDP9631400.1 AcrR family transcriptional regulator [Ensifer adhaerens]KQU82236.1 TetR family transcriptional regulator [Ensifer sp. Root31]KQW55462.1 TetR family transcriptional regulator [Ensifer sp. Root1252]KQW73646.1 TetR family transcriptional regulator [Ensifer sp. Root127]KQY69788.1 TetR family transcriptional regulator [Ensifer sp. Root142]